VGTCSAQSIFITGRSPTFSPLCPINAQEGNSEDWRVTCVVGCYLGAAWYQAPCAFNTFSLASHQPQERVMLASYPKVTNKWGSDLFEVT
jgi:hypothetical protein